MAEYRILEVITPCRRDGSNTEVISYRVQKIWLGICFRTIRTPGGPYTTIHEYGDYDSAKTFLVEYIARHQLSKPRKTKAHYFDKYGKEMVSSQSPAQPSLVEPLRDE